MSISEFESLFSLARSGAPFDSEALRHSFIQLITQDQPRCNLNHLADLLFSTALPSTYTPSSTSSSSSSQDFSDPTPNSSQPSTPPQHTSCQPQQAVPSPSPTNASETEPSSSSSSLSSNIAARKRYFEQTLDDRVSHAVNAFAKGDFVVVIDGADRENEGDLILAAEKATESKIAFMVNETSGLICCGMSGERLDSLNLPQMVPNNTDSHRTAFTISVDYNIGTTTGISAGDRAATLRALADFSVKASSFNRPGHMFPLRAREGGVLERGGHTESAVDLCRLAGLPAAGALCEIVRKDGAMMRPGELYEYADRHHLAVLTVEDLIAYRRAKAL